MHDHSALPSRAPVIVATQVDKVTTTTTASPPVRLVISGINVDATIRAVGQTSDGAMDIGENPDEVAWYKLGPRPGEIGSAVIAGHYGWSDDGHGSIFNNLHTLVAGDKIAVYDEAGGATNFIVRTSRIYDPAADATAVFTSSDGKAHLNLITCEGTWVNSADSYSNRLVVFTDLE